MNIISDVSVMPCHTYKVSCVLLLSILRVDVEVRALNLSVFICNKPYPTVNGLAYK